jgi:hypothetical protein
MNAGWIALVVLAMFYVIPPLMFLLSLLAIVRPRVAWYLGEGWKFKGVEPSSMALAMTRIGGFFGCVFSVVFLAIVVTLMPVKFGPGVPAAGPIQAAPAPAPK